MTQLSPRVRQILLPLQEFVRLESASGLVLLACSRALRRPRQHRRSGWAVSGGDPSCSEREIVLRSEARSSSFYAGFAARGRRRHARDHMPGEAWVEETSRLWGVRADSLQAALEDLSLDEWTVFVRRYGLARRCSYTVEAAGEPTPEVVSAEGLAARSRGRRRACRAGRPQSS